MPNSNTIVAMKIAVGQLMILPSRAMVQILMTRDAAQQLFSRSVIEDWSFDAEVLFIAQRRGLKIKEVPVTWHDTPGTKVRIVRDAVRALLGLFKIRLNSMRGLYR